jgi:uncharacterized protein
MRFRLRRYWPEALLSLALALPWLVLLPLGMIWLWQGGYVWMWAIAAALLGLAAWPLAVFVRRRANAEARIALGEIAEPSRGWNAVEQAAWADVQALADTTAPFTFIEVDALVAGARQTIETVARRYHPDARAAWAQFSLPEFLLLTERLSRDVRREALRYIPGVRAMRLSHLLWVQRQNELAQTGWRWGFGLWRMVRAAINPLQAVSQETKDMLMEKTARVLSYRLRTYATRLLILEVGRAAIDLYSGRLALSEDELPAARARDMAGAAGPPAPVRIVLIGQVNAGKSSLLNAMAQEIRSAVGPVPITIQAQEHMLEVEGRPAVSLVDTAGIDERAGTVSELLTQAERADLILWVASATQPAREPDRKALEKVRTRAKAELARRSAPVLLALTHVDELRPAKEWTPPYDVTAPDVPKARAIRAALDAAARTLDLPVEAIVPVALPPGQKPYNLDALWGRIALELDEAKLVQLDRLRVGQQGIRLRDVASQLGEAGRAIVTGIVRG